MRYQKWFISMNPCKQTNNIGPNYSKLRDHWNPLQLYTVHLSAAEFCLNWTCKLAVTHSILPCSSLYNLQHFSLLCVIIFLTFVQQQAMSPETLPPGVICAKSSWMTGASSNAPLGQTQQQWRHQVVHRDAAIVATEHMTQVEHLENVRKTGRSKNKKQHAVGCESIHVSVDDGQRRI